jgi:hypothetical protein
MIPEEHKWLMEADLLIAVVPGRSVREKSIRRGCPSVLPR